MEVYLVEDKNLQRVPESELETEANLERRLVRTEGAKIGDVEVMYTGRQGSPGDGGIFDLVGVDERGDAVIVELKRDRAPRDIVAQALEYAAEIRNVDYEYLDDDYQEFMREEQGYSEPDEILELREAHAQYFDLDDPLTPREFNDDQRLVVVGTDFRDSSLNMADFLREHGIDVVAVEYSTYRSEEGELELLTTDGVRRPLSEEPKSTVTSSGDSEDYSELIIAVRNQAYPRLQEELCFDEKEQMAKSSNKRNLTIKSKHPDHPDPLSYEMSPRIKEQGAVQFLVNIWNADSAQHEALRQFLAAHVGELPGYKLNEDPNRSTNVVAKEIQVNQEEIEINNLAQELVDLVQCFHPQAVDQFGDHELF